MTKNALITSIRKILMLVCFGAGLLSSGLARAEFRVEISGIGTTQIPISIGVFRGEDGMPQPLSAIIRNDLDRGGRFKLVAAGSAPIDEISPPAFADWRSKGSDALVGGSVRRLPDGRFEVRFTLWDVVKGQPLGGQSYFVAAGDLRLAAHRIADAIYELLLGEKGVFSTRIAYVSKSAGRYQLWVADADGEGAQAALTSVEPIISPTWSPDGQQLAYVSFESRKPVVYVHDVSTGQRKAVANYKGSNSAPAWSPNGRDLAVVLTKEGGSQIFLTDRNGSSLRRLTQTSGIETEPVFSADGQFIYFVSDRGGAPQIYRMSSSGGPAERVTFEGTYNISPSLSRDGRSLAYISRVGGQYKLTLMDLATRQVQGITDTPYDESPSFAPNSRLIMYVTRVQGRDVLMTTTLDGKIKTRLASPYNEAREPDWSPAMR